MAASNLLVLLVAALVVVSSPASASLQASFATPTTQNGRPLGPGKQTEMKHRAVSPRPATVTPHDDRVATPFPAPGPSARTSPARANTEGRHTGLSFPSEMQGLFMMAALVKTADTMAALTKLSPLLWASVVG